LLEGDDRFVITAQGVEGAAEVVVGGGKIGFEFDGAAVIGDGVGGAGGGLEEIAGVVLGFGEIWADGGGFDGAVGGDQQIGEIWRGRRRDWDRGAGRAGRRRWRRWFGLARRG
jgi:hypothetical protein